MKIFEVIPHLQSGGGEKFVVDFSNSVSTLGHDCTTITLFDASEDDILRRFLTSQVKTHALHKRKGLDFNCMFRLYQYIVKSKPDVVHLHLNAITYAILSALFYRKCKYFATIHSEASREAGSGINKYIRKILFKLNLVTPITISEDSEKSFELFYGFKAHMIPNGSSSYCKSENNPWEKYREGVDLLFVHAGRITGVKNQLMMVKAFDQLIKKGRNIRLLIAGRIMDENIYQQMKPYFSDRIIYIGEQQDVRAIMSVCDGFCLSSKMEGMPITIIEAFSVGCVPISTRVGGCANLIKNSVNGYLSKELTVESYISAIEQFIALNSSQRTQMKNRCFQDYKEFYSIESTAEKYLNVFKNDE